MKSIFVALVALLVGTFQAKAVPFLYTLTADSSVTDDGTQMALAGTFTWFPGPDYPEDDYIVCAANVTVGGALIPGFCDASGRANGFDLSEQSPESDSGLFFTLPLTTVELTDYPDFQIADITIDPIYYLYFSGYSFDVTGCAVMGDIEYASCAAADPPGEPLYTTGANAPAAVPEPSSLAVFVAGLFGLLAWRMQRKA